MCLRGNPVESASIFACAKSVSMSDSEFVFVYSTFPDEGAARRVGEALVTARLAACVNIYPPMHSIYEWQGKLEGGPEVAAFIKARRANVNDIIATARPPASLHHAVLSYPTDRRREFGLSRLGPKSDERPIAARAVRVYSLGRKDRVGKS